MTSEQIAAPATTMNHTNGGNETGLDQHSSSTDNRSFATDAAEIQHERAQLESAQNVQIFTGEPTGLRRLAKLELVAAMPDGTVVIWSDDDVRQAGVLETEDGRGRVVRPISIGRYEDDWHLGAVVPPVWVVTFDDPPEVHES